MATMNEQQFRAQPAAVAEVREIRNRLLEEFGHDTKKLSRVLGAARSGRSYVNRTAPKPGKAASVR